MDVKSMEKRSDSDVLLKELKLKFGDKEYTVPVLRMRAAAKWREEYFRLTKEISDANPSHLDEKDPKKIADAVARGLMAALLRFPDKIPDIVFSYAPSLKEHEEEIFENAYDSDFADAYRKIWQVAFQPFLASLGMVIEMQRSQASPSPSLVASN